ncbi:MAG TPA: hypothetical protein VFG69_02595 [Nannocystaceae bacterium]|nr:hypothetical protein [Nannocystaceae bacterium]
MLTTCVAACGPDEREPAELDRVCDEESPFRILELDPDRALASVLQREHVDGRRILRVGYLGDPPDFPDDEHPYGPNVESYEYWSVGSCGESPTRISEDAAFLVLAHWPDFFFACDRETGALEIVYPNDERQRNLVFSTHECDYQETQWGLVQVRPHDEDTGVLELLPYPDDPWTQSSIPRTLIDPIRIRAAPPHAFPEYHEVLDIFDDEVFAITPGDDLVHFSLLDGTSAIEATEVREFQVSRDLHWLIWQDTTPIGDEVEWPVGAIYLRDRATGSTRRLADAPLAGTNWNESLGYADLGLVRLQLGYLYKEPERLYRLSDLVFFDLPLGVETLGKTADGRLFVGDAFNRGNFAVVDPENGATTELFDDLATARLLDDRLEFLQGVACCIEQDGRAEGALWWVTFDGERELVARHATHFYEYLSDERVLTTVDIDDEWRGELIVVDRDDLEERAIDDHVTQIGQVVEDDTILYGVSDHERTGVWLARPASR